LELSQSGAGAANVFTKWRHKYGPIFTYWLGKIPVVCVADYQKLVETLQRDGESYAARPEGFAILPVFSEENSKLKNNAKLRFSPIFAITFYATRSMGQMPMIPELDLFTPKLSMNGLFSQFIYLL
jgi:hypothetical protein